MPYNTDLHSHSSKYTFDIPIPQHCGFFGAFVNRQRKKENHSLFFSLMVIVVFSIFLVGYLDTLSLSFFKRLCCNCRSLLLSSSHTFKNKSWSLPFLLSILFFPPLPVWHWNIHYCRRSNTWRPHIHLLTRTIHFITSGTDAWSFDQRIFTAHLFAGPEGSTKSSWRKSGIERWSCNRILLLQLETASASGIKLHNRKSRQLHKTGRWESSKRRRIRSKANGIRHSCTSSHVNLSPQASDRHTAARNFSCQRARAEKGVSPNQSLHSI